MDIRYPLEATPPNEAYFAEEIKHLQGKFKDKIRIVADPWLASWTERYEKRTTLAVAGDAPDLIWLCCELIRPYFSAGNAEVLDPHIKRDWRSGQADDFCKGMWEGS